MNKSGVDPAPVRLRLRGGEISGRGGDIRATGTVLAVPRRVLATIAVVLASIGVAPVAAADDGWPTFVAVTSLERRETQSLAETAVAAYRTGKFLGAVRFVLVGGGRARPRQCASLPADVERRQTSVRAAVLVHGRRCSRRVRD
jgi:hypothetical protein